MTALTHAQCIDAFEHITRNVLWQEDGDPLLKALANAGIDDINGLLILDEQQIDELKYDNGGNMTLLNAGTKNLVTTFVAYVCHRILNDTPIGNDYLSVMEDDFEEYRVNDYLLAPDATTTPKSHDAVADFFRETRQQSHLLLTLKLKKFHETEEVEDEETAEPKTEVDSSPKPDPSLHATTTPHDYDPVADFLTVIRHNSNLVWVLRDIKRRGENNNNCTAALAETTIADNADVVIKPLDTPAPRKSFADVVIKPPDTPAPRKSLRNRKPRHSKGKPLTGKLQTKKSVTTTSSSPGPPKEPPPPPPPPDVRW
jgi:hypothetical protein